MSKSLHIYGFHSVEAQIKSNPECILNVFVQSGKSDSRTSKIISVLSSQKINFSKINKNRLDRLAKGELHQGIIAEVILPSLLGHEALIDFVTKLSSIPLILMLEGSKFKLKSLISLKILFSKNSNRIRGSCAC